jgi:hypothetical protein
VGSGPEGMGLGFWFSGLGLRLSGGRKAREVRSFRAPPLFDKCIGRKRDVGGGFLAGRRFRLGFGVSWIRGEGEIRRDADGHVSKFIAPGLRSLAERRETVGWVWAWADVFGTRQE